MAKKASASAKHQKNAGVLVGALLDPDKMEAALKHPTVGRILKKLEPGDIRALTGMAKTIPKKSHCIPRPPP
jgi:hypothetical protein